MMLKKIKRARLGDVLKIPLYEGRWGYGVVTQNHAIGFYDILSDKDIEIAEIAQKPILFRVVLTPHACNGKEWPVVGSIQLTGELELPQRFLHIHSDIDAGEYLATTTFRDKIPIAREEARELELFSIYDPMHIEERLRDHFEGKVNIAAIRIKIVD